MEIWQGRKAMIQVCRGKVEAPQRLACRANLYFLITRLIVGGSPSFIQGQSDFRLNLHLSPCVEIMTIKVIGCLIRARGKWESESVFHLMPESMFCRLDPLSTALFSNSYGIRNLPSWE